MELKVAQKLAAGREPVRIVAFGDSITGVYYHTGGRRAWPEMLAVALGRLYPGADVQVVNAGISGNTTVAALARIEADVLAHRPDLVVVMFGMNDVTGIPPETYRANLAEIVRRCTATGTEVVLCTPNSIYDEDPGRPLERLAAYAGIVREVATTLGVPVADHFAVYEGIRRRDERAWAELMSETIHPNMRGHKAMAEEVAWVISGRRVALDDVGPLLPGLPRTLECLQTGQPVQVLAMPPYDELIRPALMAVRPDARVQVTRWETAGKSLADLESEARAMGWSAPSDGGSRVQRDLTIVAVPATALAADARDYYRRYSWVLNWSLSFGALEWDCLVVLPSVADPQLSLPDQAAEALALRVAQGQDLPYLTRTAGDQRPAATLFGEWVRRQLQSP